MKTSNKINKVNKLKTEIEKMRIFLEFLNGKNKNKSLNKKNVN